MRNTFIAAMALGFAAFGSVASADETVWEHDTTVESGKLSLQHRLIDVENKDLQHFDLGLNGIDVLGLDTDVHVRYVDVEGATEWRPYVTVNQDILANDVFALTLGHSAEYRMFDETAGDYLRYRGTIKASFDLGGISPYVSDRVAFDVTNTDMESNEIEAGAGFAFSENVTVSAYYRMTTEDFSVDFDDAEKQVGTNLVVRF